MIRWMTTAALLALAACGAKDDDDTGETDADTDTDATGDTDTDVYTGTDTDTDVPVETDTDTDLPTTAPACEPLTSGDWEFSGTAFGMDMLGKLQSDGACAFTLGDWNMDMGEMPTGGTVTGSDVALTGNNFWASCTGAVTAPDQIQGTCGDGSKFAMQLR